MWVILGCWICLQECPGSQTAGWGWAAASWRSQLSVAGNADRWETMRRACPTLFFKNGWPHISFAWSFIHVSVSSTYLAVVGRSVFSWWSCLALISLSLPFQASSKNDITKVCKKVTEVSPVSVKLHSCGLTVCFNCCSQFFFFFLKTCFLTLTWPIKIR